MKGFRALIVLITLLHVSVCVSQEGRVISLACEINPGNLDGHVYVPKSNNDTLKKRPLVIALHGCSQNQNSFASQSGWDKLADNNNFLVLYPGQKRVNNPNNCFNWFNTKDITKNKGELQSIMTMIDEVVKTQNIDTTRIYVHGVSAGAAMGVCMLAVYPSYFQSGAIFAGAPYGAAKNAWQAAKIMIKTINRTPQEWGELVDSDIFANTYPKLIICHGTRDQVVHIENSYELIDQWSYLHQMDTIPDDTLIDFQTKQIKRFMYKDSSQVSQIIFYKIKDLGHALPVDPGDNENQGGITGVFAKDIDFFSTYFIAKDFGIITTD